MQKHEYLVLSFFEKKIPKEMTLNDLSIEMIDAAIGSDSGSTYDFNAIIYQLLNSDLLKKYKDPLDNRNGLVKAVGHDLLVLTDKGSELVIRDKENKKQSEIISALEFNNLKDGYSYLKRQLEDYDETKIIARKANIYSKWSLIVAILAIIVSIFLAFK